MPVTGGGTAEPIDEPEPYVRTVPEAAFLRHLRLTQRMAPPGGSMYRHRMADFMDEACPISSDDVYSEPEGSSGEDDCDLPLVDHAGDFTQLATMLQALPGPSSCSFLTTGQSFAGSQRLSSVPVGAAEDWQVIVRLQGIDLSKGYVCGVMEAVNVPHASAPIITFWEGEIVDNANHTFLTRKWGASRDIDMKHWGKFSGFASLEHDVARSEGHSPDLSTSQFIFMRWKETMFVNSSEACGLTIAGFYYVCLDRQNGTVVGYYYDPNSAPFQFLSLKPQVCDGGGMSFGSYSIA